MASKINKMNSIGPQNVPVYTSAEKMNQQILSARRLSLSDGLTGGKVVERLHRAKTIDNSYRSNTSFSKCVNRALSAPLELTELSGFLIIIISYIKIIKTWNDRFNVLLSIKFLFKMTIMMKP